jgi:hypothetical protein
LVPVKEENCCKEKNMGRSYIAENRESRERMQKLVNSLTEEDLNLILYKEGWTIAAALAHIAFWDQRRLLLVRKWLKEGISPSVIDENLVNDALVTFFLALPPRKAADLAISIAAELDNELERLTDSLVETISGLGDRHALNRAIHRKMHLDDIDKLLLARPLK